MDINIKDEQLSDDEIFFGKLTLKELKKHILWDKHHQPWSISAVNSPTVNDPNTSLKIIQTQSQPNLISDRKDCSSPAQISPCKIENVLDDNDSFIKMENMVANICLSPRNIGKTELNNTLEVIEYILNNPPTDEDNNKLENEKQIMKSDIIKDPICQSPEKLVDQAKTSEVVVCQPKASKMVTNINKHEEALVTPKKYPDSHFTPKCKSKPVFKTPAQPLSHKKSSASSVKKTPSKTNIYQHISSPVASYINNCPIVPLVKDVHPKRPLPGASSIPKFVKNTLPTKSNDKENVNLPSVAYKSAKKTKVIDIPDEHKLPQSQWAKKIFSSLPKPTVIKHTHREMNLAKRILTNNHQEDSFANLSYQQAEVSVCTQKSAFKHKNNV